MATVTELYNGSESISGTEHSMVTDSAAPQTSTVAGAMQIWLDLSAMAIGNILHLRVYEKVRSSGTQRLVWEAFFRDSQSTPHWVSPTLLMKHGWDVTLTALSGTPAVEWSIRHPGA